MTGYDLFPNTNVETEVKNALATGNTNLILITDNNLNTQHEIPADVIITFDQLIQFFNLHCERSSDGDSAGSPPRYKLYYKSYLAGINDYGEAGIDDLGITIAPGIPHWSLSFILVNKIRYRHSLGFYSPYSDIDIVKASTIHELGHLKADLTHLCDSQDDHDDYRCIMSENLPDAVCTPYYDVLEYGIRFCDSCKTNIKNVTW